MSQEGDIAGNIAHMSVDATIKVTEAALRLTGLGVKNLAALLIALAKDNRKLAGKTKLTNLLLDNEPPAVFNLKKDDLIEFKEKSKQYGVLYCPVRDRKSKSDNLEIITRQKDLPRINTILEKMGYAKVKEADPKSKSQAQHENDSKMPELGSKQTQPENMTTDEKAPIRGRLEAYKNAATNIEKVVKNIEKER